MLGNVSLRKRKRLAKKDREANSEIFEILQGGSDEEKILLFLRESGKKGLLVDEIGVRLGLFGKQLKKVVAEPLSKKRMVVVDSATQRYLEQGRRGSDYRLHI